MLDWVVSVVLNQYPGDASHLEEDFFLQIRHSNLSSRPKWSIVLVWFELQKTGNFFWICTKVHSFFNRTCWYLCEIFMLFAEHYSLELHSRRAHCKNIWFSKWLNYFKNPLTFEWPFKKISVMAYLSKWTELKCILVGMADCGIPGYSLADYLN